MRVQLYINAWYSLSFNFLFQRLWFEMKILITIHIDTKGSDLSYLNQVYKERITKLCFKINLFVIQTFDQTTQQIMIILFDDRLANSNNLIPDWPTLVRRHFYID